MPEGWGWEEGLRKAHYFVAGISLCGKWGDKNFNGLNLWKKGCPENPNNCVICEEKLKETT